MTLLYEEYLQCGGQWENSQLVARVRLTNKEKRWGRVVWLTKAGLLQKYGQDNTDLVRDIIARKVASGDVRAHPDCPDRVDARLYRVWDSSGEEVSEIRDEENELSVETAVDASQMLAFMESSEFFQGDRASSSTTAAMMVAEQKAPPAIVDTGKPNKGGRGAKGAADAKDQETEDGAPPGKKPRTGEKKQVPSHKWVLVNFVVVLWSNLTLLPQVPEHVKHFKKASQTINTNLLQAKGWKAQFEVQKGHVAVAMVADLDKFVTKLDAFHQKLCLVKADTDEAQTIQDRTTEARKLAKDHCFWKRLGVTLTVKNNPSADTHVTRTLVRWLPR